MWQSGHNENGQDVREDLNKLERQPQPQPPPGSCVAKNSQRLAYVETVQGAVPPYGVTETLVANGKCKSIIIQYIFVRTWQISSHRSQSCIWFTRVRLPMSPRLTTLRVLMALSFPKLVRRTGKYNDLPRWKPPAWVETLPKRHRSGRSFWLTFDSAAFRISRSNSGLSRNELFMIELRSSQGQPLKYLLLSKKCGVGICIETLAIVRCSKW